MPTLMQWLENPEKFKDDLERFFNPSYLHRPNDVFFGMCDVLENDSYERMKRNGDTIDFVKLSHGYSLIYNWTTEKYSIEKKLTLLDNMLEKEVEDYLKSLSESWTYHESHHESEEMIDIVEEFNKIGNLYPAIYYQYMR